MYTFQTTFTITYDMFEDVIETGFEFGIGYWAKFGHHDKDAESLVITYNGSDFEDNDPRSSGTALVSYADIAQVIENIHKGETRVGNWLVEQLNSWLAGEPSMDSDLADVILQLACFNEIVYG